MRKLLVLAIFSLTFAVTQAADRGYSPDVGFELSITQLQPVGIMPAMVADCQFVLPFVNEIVLAPHKNTFVSIPIGNIIAYHNPDYGRCNKYKMNLLIATEIGNNHNALVTTRHVI